MRPLPRWFQDQGIPSRTPPVPQSEPAANPPLPARHKICIMATTGGTIYHHMDGRLQFLVARGFDITVVCAPPGAALAEKIRRCGVHLHAAPLTRSITPLHDLRGLWHVWRFFRRERFALVEFGTPKAALLGSIAAWLAGIPCRIYLLHGLLYLGRGRVSAAFRKWLAWIPACFAQRLLCVSPSLAAQAVADGLAPAARVATLGHGSVNGVDLDRYRPHRPTERAAIRAKYAIPADAVVVGFVARLRGEKGIAELVDAFTALKDRHPQLYLLIVGDYDIEDRPPERIVETLAREPRIKCPGWQDDCTPFFAAMDIYCMPTYRDGFGVVFIEAAACGLPSVGTDVIGARDAIEPGVSGFRVPARSAAAVSDALERLLSDADLRQRLGVSARRWAEANFDRHQTWAQYEQEYRALLGDA